jgi:epoxyqueuosine reductase QueG
MNIAGQEEIDREYLTRFFRDNGVDTFAVVSPSSIHAPPGRRPTDLLPSCRAVILFGKVMQDDLFFGTGRETSLKVARFKAGLNGVTDDLVRSLNESGNGALTVRSVTVKDGTILGCLSLKQSARDAGIGSIGECSLLLSPRFGNRLALAAVLTDRDFGPYPAVVNTDDICHHCYACVHACPEHVLTPGSVDFLKCRNVTGGLPHYLRPLATRLLRSSCTTPFLNPLVNHLAKNSMTAVQRLSHGVPSFPERRTVND